MHPLTLLVIGVPLLAMGVVVAMCCRRADFPYLSTIVFAPLVGTLAAVTLIAGSQIIGGLHAGKSLQQAIQSGLGAALYFSVAAAGLGGVPTLVVALVTQFIVQQTCQTRHGFDD